jgi:hypothetical protein
MAYLTCLQNMFNESFKHLMQVQLLVPQILPGFPSRIDETQKQWLKDPRQAQQLRELYAEVAMLPDMDVEKAYTMIVCE